MTASEPTVREAVVRKPGGKTQPFVFGAMAILLVVGALHRRHIFRKPLPL